MKKIVMRSITASLAVTFLYSNCFIASGIDVRRFKSYDEDEMVSVFVKVDGEPVLASDNAAEMGSDYLATSEAKDYTSELEDIQNDALSYIESFYPDLDTEYACTDLVNGFSCEIPEELIDEVEKCPEITSVHKTQRYYVPELANASEVGSVNTYKESTGVMGDGETIAVIDTEIDVTHQMFSAIDDIDVQFTKDDIANIIADQDLNADCNAEDVYFNSKIPFAYSYTNLDNPYEVANEDNYHGTHVCGIVAGNEVLDDNSQEISGIAPNAQIIFLGVFEYFEDENAYGANDFVVVSAMEDAAKMGVSTINMSLGSDCEDNAIYNEAVSSAENAGIVICAAAGNDSTGIYNNYPENVDTSTLISPSSIDGVVSVASCDNGVKLCGDLTLSGDSTPIIYSDVDENMGLQTFYGGSTMQYVYCNNGTTEDFNGLDLTDKAILCDVSDLSFDTVAENASDTNAVAIIFCDTVDESLKTVFDNFDSYTTAIFVTKADGERLKNASKKEFTINENSSNLIPTAVKISYFTSSGVSENLKLKPDITGVGGEIKSANYGNNFSYISGTSMASPYLAGCFMLCDEYVKKTNPELVGKEKAVYLKNILMNSAKPLIDDSTGLFNSPRLQGAGVVSLSNFLNDTVIMTGNEGEAKINLYDNLTNRFTLPVTITNSSNTNVTFDDAKLAVTTDSTLNDEYESTVISSIQELTASYDLSELTTIPANSSKTINISVELDPAQIQSIGSVFTNGFFIEGFLLLGESENCCDISIPFLGFYGDWSDVPIFDKVITDTSNVNGINTPFSYFKDMKFPLGFDLQYFKQLLMSNENSNEIPTPTYYISPNGDGIMDTLNYSLAPLRESVDTKMTITDSNGETVALTYDGLYTYKNTENDLTLYDTDIFENGKTYTATITGHINYTGAENHIQSTQFDFTVDTTAPEIVSKKTSVNSDGRQILEMTVSDSTALNGIIVLGKGTGGLDGEYDPKHPDKTGINLEELFSIDTDEFDDDDDISVGSLSSLNIIKAVCDAKNFTNGFSSDILGDDILDDFDFTFGDLIIPTANDDNTFTFRYDITDFEIFDFITLDCAYNMVEYAGSSPVVENIKVENQFYGEKLGLTAPKVYSELELTKSCWQISFDGKSWEEFDVQTIMTDKHNGAYIRYFAENTEGYGHSNYIQLKLKSADSTPAKSNNTNSNGKAEISTLTNANPATGGGTILITSTILLGAIITLKQRKR